MYVCYLSACVILFSRHSSFHALAYMAGLSSKLGHLEDKGVTEFTASTEKGWNEMKV
jgi:hypothetical protein